MPEFQCKAILFDLDGVLVDSTKSVIEVWSAWSERNGIPPARTLDVIHGRRTIEGLQILAPHLDLKAEVEKIESAVTLKKGGTTAIPGAAELLASLPDGRWAVVTSGLREFAKIRLRDANLPIPKVLVTADDVTNGKPHPEPYLKGAELLGASPEECLVVEDAPAGIRSAHAGGMRAMGITTTYPAAELHEADAVIHGLSQIRTGYGDHHLQIHLLSSDLSAID
jgi:mannitol-1-/sugar-/sorbitol-6-phosphatase